MSISIKSCAICGQINPASSGFCPVCGRALSSVDARVAPWTAANEFPPIPDALKPKRRRRYRSDGEGTGLAWIGLILITLPLLFNSRTSFMNVSWATGLLLILIGFWQMRRDPDTLARAGIMTNLIAAITLAAIVVKLVDTNSSEPTELPALALTSPTTTPVPDWASTPADSATPAGSMPMYLGGPAHTGENPGPGPVAPLFRKWRVDTLGELYSSPAIVDGTVYVGSKSGFLYAYDAETGSETWRKDLGEYTVRSSPAVVDGRLYVGAGYWLFSLDAQSREEKWRAKIPFAGPSSPTVADGVVYIGSQSGWVYAFDVATGDERWHFQTDSLIFSAPTVAGGLVLVGTDSGRIQALDAKSGQPKWSYTAPGAVYGTLATADGLVYFCSRDAEKLDVTALEMAHGTRLWSYAAGGEGSPAVAGGLVFVGAGDGGLYAIDAKSGQRRWLFPTGSTIASSPVVAGDTVYVASGKTLYAVRRETGVKIWSYPAGYTIETSPVVVGGIVVLGGRDGYLDAIATADQS